MMHVACVPVPSRGAASFAPGGDHLTCMEPRGDMKVGASVPVTLSKSIMRLGDPEQITATR